METIRGIFGYPSSYYNCSGKTKEEWMKTGEKWPALGMLLIMGGTLYMVLYLPTIYALIKLKLTRNDCYKIMLCLIMADMGNLFTNSFVAGYVFSVGGVFCMNPVWMYISGAYNFTIWSLASYLYVLLAVNRFLVVLANPTLDHLFNKVPINLWLLLGMVYGLSAGLGSKPLPFNSRAFGGIYVPAIQDLAIEFPIYINRWHAYHNLSIGVLIFILYGAVAIILLRKGDDSKISKGEMNALLQAFMVTLPAMLAAWLYVYIQFFDAATLEMAITAHFAWQTVSGISALIYLTLNQSVRSYYKGSKVSSIYLEDSSRDRKQISGIQATPSPGSIGTKLDSTV